MRARGGGVKFSRYIGIDHSGAAADRVRATRRLRHAACEGWILGVR
jgi:hypothetical protein